MQTEASLPDVLNVLFVNRGDEQAMARVEAVAPGRIQVARLGDEFADDVAREWSRSQRPDPAAPLRTPEELDRLLRDTHITYAAHPFPKTLPRRLPNLIWAHFGFAGVSNLMGSDWWAPPFLVTSARGINSALPIAETAMAAVFMFSKRLDLAVPKSNARDFGGRYSGVRLLAGKTLGIVGLGGIGSNLARLARSCGMRVFATRRSASERRQDTDGVDVLYPPSQLHEMLSESAFVAICAMWTPETERMLDTAAFAAVKPGAYLINIARGEIIDETALAAALESGKLAAAYLDVWDDDLYGKDPSPALQAAPNIIFTGHSSGRSDVPQGFSLDLFCRNLQHLLAGEPLENVVDWSRGY
jgi:phosphoglycerate dehydrogenase-like enzyme